VLNIQTERHDFLFLQQGAQEKEAISQDMKRPITKDTMSFSDKAHVFRRT
jgi:hypothetical protein